MASSSTSSTSTFRVAVIGGGPAGLMAADILSARGCRVDVYDAMPSVGRKFLLAGRGGMNITHAEPFADFVTRYGHRASDLRPMLESFGPEQLRAWIHQLGIDTFVGSSGRVFPTDMKAAPLLRAWLHRLREAGVAFHARHRWSGWSAHTSADGYVDADTDWNADKIGGADRDVDSDKKPDALTFATPDGPTSVTADAVVLALGGASWARLGSDGAWVPLLADAGVDVAPLQAANCGFDVGWSAHFRDRHAGEPLLTVAIESTGADGACQRKQGQFVVTAGGVEGSLIYALSAALRDQIARDGNATIHLDLLPDWTLDEVVAEVGRPRGARSVSSHLQSRLGVKGVKAGLLRERLSAAQFADPSALARAIKRLPLTLRAPRPIDEAISSAGGVRFEAMEGLMLRARPGVFAAGEMLDWEAPTGGYLLTACFASGRACALQALDWLALVR